jgi:SAM-dependent methyltransferase
MLDWNPALYRRYEDERTRPAQELLARVPLSSATRAVDLGCGPGNSTELLVQRFPGAEVIGTDNSEAMLKSARERLPAAHFELSDIASWQPEGELPRRMRAARGCRLSCARRWQTAAGLPAHVRPCPRKAMSRTAAPEAKVFQ